MVLLSRLLVLLLACGAGLRTAHGTERPGDAAFVYALQDRTEVASALERDMLVLIERSSDEPRFELYLTYNRLVGAWLQVDLSQELLEDAAAASSPLEEAQIRTTLRDQARFALWDLEEARVQLERAPPGAEQPEHSRLHAAIRMLLADTRTVIGRLLADQCTQVQCAADP
jgi:hypothetical protein